MSIFLMSSITMLLLVTLLVEIDTHQGNRKIAELGFATLAIGAGLEILSRRSSRVRIPYL